LEETEQVLVVDGFLAVGEFGEAGVNFVELVAVEQVAEFFETVGLGRGGRSVCGQTIFAERIQKMAQLNH
jgi:hypothetical protein